MAKTEETGGAAWPLDKAKAPGGVYGSPDGTFHDADGRAVTKDGKRLGVGAAGPEAEDDDAWRADMEAQRLASAEGEGTAPAPKRKK